MVGDDVIEGGDGAEKIAQAARKSAHIRIVGVRCGEQVVQLVAETFI